MPVRSLSSSVMRWPEPEAVLTAARHWAERLAHADSSVVAVGCFGSYARGDAAMGSDLDLLAIVAASSAPHRTGAWSVEQLPTPTDLLVYTVDQWRELSVNSPRFYDTLCGEARWLWGAPP
jgi:uncharacterized protein